MAHTKRNLFAVLGWLFWKVLTLVGLPVAKRKLAERGSTPRGGARRA
ncbi:hypothetical protein F4692_001924 [Nocardioides cavernae]|uniref:Uncharacterized protein n=1 Tax=Nocardioides cavernae TaxID=1921566 RepID=A0A7Y9KPJ6_9ACTN|nr:hypothetical protein [Nocardioides cavernae]NYE36791.1 hypothetical protein [Nocardioides cavernae]